MIRPAASTNPLTCLLSWKTNVFVRLPRNLSCRSGLTSDLQRGQTLLAG